MPITDQAALQKIMDEQAIIKQMSKNVVEDVFILTSNVVNLSKRVEINNTNVMSEINKANQNLEFLNKKIDSILIILKNL
jgi:hypothetical protein